MPASGHHHLHPLHVGHPRKSNGSMKSFSSFATGQQGLASLRQGQHQSLYPAWQRLMRSTSPMRGTKRARGVRDQTPEDPADSSSDETVPSVHTKKTRTGMEP